MGDWAIAYALTCLIEIPIVVSLTRALGWRRAQLIEAILVAWVLQLTHPLLWMIAPTGAALLAAELVIVVLEGLALSWWAIVRGGARRRSRTVAQALAISFIANGASAVIGVLLSLAL